MELLEDISTYQRDMEIAHLKEKEEKKQKEESDRSKGVDMRKAAMETYSRKLPLLFIIMTSKYIYNRT